jgi:hypothetical protein
MLNVVLNVLYLVIGGITTSACGMDTGLEYSGMDDGGQRHNVGLGKSHARHHTLTAALFPAGT